MGRMEGGREDVQRGVEGKIGYGDWWGEIGCGRSGEEGNECGMGGVEVGRGVVKGEVGKEGGRRKEQYGRKEVSRE